MSDLESSSPLCSSSQAERLDAFEVRLGYAFRNRELLATALRHSSRAHEDGVLSNERLEFLGDAVLGLAVAHTLYAVHSDWAEGELTRAQAAVVGGSPLAGIARRIALGEALALGRSELRSGGASKDTILEDAMEAVLAAMYLDGGLDAVQRFVRTAFSEILSSGAAPVGRDPKTVLNELAVAQTGEYPIYELVGDSGEEQAEARFLFEVRLQGRVLGSGAGRSKRIAQVAAAQAALERGAEADG